MNFPDPSPALPAATAPGCGAAVPSGRLTLLGAQAGISEGAGYAALSFTNPLSEGT